MLLKTDTYQVQKTLANYCRDGKDVSIKGVTPNRLHTYRRLVINVAKDTLESAFPIAAKYIDDAIFEEMATQFFEEHSCESPLLWQMPLEFYHFALSKKYSEKYNLPYLNNLLWFEWLEVELYMMEDKPYPEFQSKGDIYESRLAFNPEYKLVKLEYPVHLKEPEKAVLEKGDYFLLMFRERESGKIQFVNLSVLYAYLLERLLGESVTINDLLEDIIYLFGFNDMELLKTNISRFINDLSGKGFIPGFLK